MNQQQLTEFSRIIKLQSIIKNEYSISIKANSKECKLLADRLGLIKLNSLSANLCLSSRKGGRVIKLNGSFQANVMQTCVVTLEEVSNKVEGNLDIIYDSALEVEIKKEENIDFEELIKTQKSVEPLMEDYIDVGEVVSEQLALEIDFFPRKVGASFVQYSTEFKEKNSSYEKSKDGTKAKNGPFSILKDFNKSKK